MKNWSRPLHIMRIYFWLCVACLAAYILVSLAFLMEGPSAFGRFQHQIFSHPVSYIVLFSSLVLPVLQVLVVSVKEEAES